MLEQRIFRVIANEGRSRKVYVDFDLHSEDKSILIARLFGHFDDALPIDHMICQLDLKRLGFSDVRIIHCNDPDSIKWGRRLLFTSSPKWDKLSSILLKAFMPILIAVFLIIISVFIFNGSVK
ncbi:hypothetical protein F400_gp014 [Bacillus phage BCD7]|uniref:Uncharacterized protein n=1 Tax=Bacillus phage BCD7 TaxID=1136534 RepID=J9PUK6_9CAUD|nr:hypothetical protein F400_gp014 [Bacillus phage BCD7]AEZ50461.1 hypothetical protein BCD7_0014 [Bacillus phage BCD7]